VKIQIALGLAALLLLSGSGVRASTAVVVVRLAPQVVVQAEEIMLGDLGTVEGDGALARRLRQLRLGPAPLPGESRQIDGEHLRLRLGDSQLEPGRVRLIAPERILVTRAFQVLPAAAVTEAVSRQARERLEARDPSGGPYVVVAASRPDDLRIPTGRVDLTSRLQSEPALGGMFGATVTIAVEGRTYQTVPLSFRVGRYQSVVVAARALDPRTAIEAGDLRQESRPSIDVPPGALGSLPDPADLEVVRFVRAGEVLMPSMLRQKTLVRRGDVVTLVLQGRGFRITTKGLAGADARRGESLRVLNPMSRRETLGMVEGPGLVRVPFGGSEVEP
jgi:flagella basal body P-ring formation protein FlgA